MVGEFGSAIRADVRRGYAAARSHRAELLATIQLFERALAVPAGDPGWRSGVAERVVALRDAFAEHMVVTEGADGLYAGLLDDAPRLARGVGVLVREHSTLMGSIDALLAFCAGAEADIERVRLLANGLLHGLSQHRQRGADLVYEAYATDIGGEN